MSKPSQRGWEILLHLVQERAKKAGPDGDLAEDEKEELLEEASSDARKLLADRSYQRLRLEGLSQIVRDFTLWLDLDPAHPHFDRELKGLHYRASSRFYELFRPEMVIAEAKTNRRKKNAKEESDGDRLRKG